MSFVYVVLDMGKVYPVAFSTYAAAVAAVKEMRREVIEEYRQYLEEANDDPTLAESDINVQENKETGKTYLFIEMGKIVIDILRLPIVV